MKQSVDISPACARDPQMRHLIGGICCSAPLLKPYLPNGQYTHFFRQIGGALRSFIPILLTLSLAGCGAVYITPSIVEETTSVGSVTVTPIDASSIGIANSSPYNARTLPQIFSTTTPVGTSALGDGDLPGPAFLPETRPNIVETRLPPATTPQAYRIGVGDVVLLATPQAGTTVEELSGLLDAQNRRQGYTVQDDGAIAIPDVGRISLGGLTIEQAEAEVFRRLVESQINPAFSLEIAEFNSQRVILGGAVTTSTVVPIALTPLDLGEALSAAGGITAGDPDFVIIRLYRDGTIYQVPLVAYLENPSIQNITLVGGDSIFVDTAFDLAKAQGYFEQQIRLAEFRQSSREAALTQLNAEVALRRAISQEGRTNFETRLALDAVVRDYVYLAGEVGVQGRYTLPFERRASLADALYDEARGVPTNTGNIAEVYVLRDMQTGSGIVAWRLDARNAANLVLATQFELRPNDIVFVAEQPVTAWNRVIQQITPSLITSTVGAATN